MSCHTSSYSKRLLFQISPLHYIGQQSYCRSTPSLCSMYPIHDRTNGYNGSLWFYQIWDTYFQIKCTWRLLLQKSQNTPPTEASTNRGLAISEMKAQVPILRGEGCTPCGIPSEGPSWYASLSPQLLLRSSGVGTAPHSPGIALYTLNVFTLQFNCLSLHYVRFDI